MRRLQKIEIGALLLARLGANVVVNDVSEKNAKAVVDEIITGSKA